MPDKHSTIFLATRGSALALAQTNMILAECRAAFPKLRFDTRVIKTTGDKMQTASLAQGGKNLPKGLFTKELEVALLEGDADLAVHSLKDLPTELPVGLALGAVTERADVRDVLIYREAAQRGFESVGMLEELPQGAKVGTSSTRRRAQLLAQRPDLDIVEVRGNIISRLGKLARKQMDALVLAAAGLERMKFIITPEGQLSGEGIPKSLRAMILDLNVMLPCVGQGALGIEIREDDTRIGAVCERLNHFFTERCVTAERAFLAAMGGGCASPVAAYAEVIGNKIQMRAISFPDGIIRGAEATSEFTGAEAMGRQLAAELKNKCGLESVV